MELPPTPRFAALTSSGESWVLSGLSQSLARQLRAEEGRNLQRYTGGHGRAWSGGVRLSSCL